MGFGNSQQTKILSQRIIEISQNWENSQLLVTLLVKFLEMGVGNGITFKRIVIVAMTQVGDIRALTSASNVSLPNNKKQKATSTG